MNMLMKRKKWNKKGLAFIWVIPATLAGLGYVMSQFGPSPTGVAAIPIWGWIVGGLVILMLLKKK